MGTKFLYILVSQGKDIFYEQTLVSVLSLRYHNPDAFISLLVDDGTDKNLVDFRGQIKDLVNEYKVVEYPKETSNKVRSRLLKTNMRNLIDGDFLYHRQGRVFYFFVEFFGGELAEFADPAGGAGVFGP